MPSVPVQMPQAPLPQGTIQQILRALQNQAIRAASAVLDRLDVSGDVRCNNLTARSDIRINALSLPRGKLGYAQITANSGSAGGTPLAVGGLGVTVSVPANRRIRVTVAGNMAKDATAALVRMYIYETTSGSTQLQRGLTFVDANSFELLTLCAVLQPTAGTHTYNMFISADAGNVSIEAAAGDVAYTLVEDIGQ